MTLSATEALPERCSMAFAPAPELAVETADAAARWSAATGCDIHVAADGIPVTGVPQLYVDVNGESKAACGGTAWASWTDASEITISTASEIDDCATVGYTVLHEMGHALAHAQGHSDDGIMAARVSHGDRAVIDSSSLDLVCAGLDCSVYLPEDDLSDVADLQTL